MGEAMGNMLLLDVPMVDWLTLTTDDGDAWRGARFDWQRFHDAEVKAFNKLHRKNAGSEGAMVFEARKYKVLQYDGQVIGGVFFGAGNQQGKEHYMIRVSGGRANEFAMHASRVVSDMRCTRMDVQVTVSKPLDWDVLKMRAQVDSYTDALGRERITEVILGKKNINTLYMGSRTSMRFVRVYVKPTDGLEVLLRYELELKKLVANRAWKHYGDVGAVACAEILSSSVGKIPKSVTEADCFRFITEVKPEELRVGRVVRGDNSTVRWFMDAVLPAFARLASDHETREWAVDIVGEMLLIIGDDYE